MGCSPAVAAAASAAARVAAESAAVLVAVEASWRLSSARAMAAAPVVHDGEVQRPSVAPRRAAQQAAPKQSRRVEMAPAWGLCAAALLHDRLKSLPPPLRMLQQLWSLAEKPHHLEPPNRQRAADLT